MFLMSKTRSIRICSSKTHFNHYTHGSNIDVFREEKHQGGFDFKIGNNINVIL